MNVLKKIFGVVMPLVVGCGIALLLNAFVLTIVTVDGESMEPNLHDRDKVVALKFKDVTRNAVVLFEANGVDPKAQGQKQKLYVKRVIGVPGDEITYTNEGDLFVNGVKDPQNYLTEPQKINGTLDMLQGNLSSQGFTLASLSQQQNWPSQTTVNKVPTDSYFVMGDNRAISNDSRAWGFVPKDKIKGVVYAPFWIEHDGLIN